MSSKPDGSTIADFWLYANPTIADVYDPATTSYATALVMPNPRIIGFRSKKFPPGVKFDPAQVVTVYADPKNDAGLIFDDSLYGPSAGYGPAQTATDPAKAYGNWASIAGVPANPLTDWGLLDAEGHTAEYQDPTAAFRFYKWVNSKNYLVGKMHVSNGVTGFTLTNVFWKSSTGKLGPVGKWEYIKDDNDTAFAFALSLAAMAIGQAWVTALGSSFLSGDYQGAALALAKSNLPVDTPAIPSGGLSMDELDFGDYNPWDAFGFADADAYAVMSDAQWADYGFGPVDYTGGYDSPVGLDVNASAGLSGDLTFNATPEVTTNDYGTQFEGVAKVAVPVATTALKLAGTPSGPPPANKATIGPLVPKPTSGTNDILGTIGNVLSTASQGLGVMSQVNKMSQDSSFAGQLTPNGGATSGTIAGIPSNYLLIAGAALLVVAVLMHAKG